jgi:hypothetical protein
MKAIRSAPKSRPAQITIEAEIETLRTQISLALIAACDALRREFSVRFAELEKRYAVLDDESDPNAGRWPPPAPWTTIKRATYESGYADSTIRKMAKLGTVPSYRVGGRIAVNIDTLAPKKGAKK